MKYVLKEEIFEIPAFFSDYILRAEIWVVYLDSIVIQIFVKKHVVHGRVQHEAVLHYNGLSETLYHPNIRSLGLFSRVPESSPIILYEEAINMVDPS